VEVQVSLPVNKSTESTNGQQFQEESRVQRNAIYGDPDAFLDFLVEQDINLYSEKIILN